MNSCQFHCKTTSSSQLLCEQCFTQNWTWTYLNKSLRQLIQSISNNSSPNQSKSSSFTVYQMHRTGVSSAGSTKDLIPDFISVKNPKDLGRNEPLLAFQRDYHSLQMKLNIFSALRYEKIAISLPLRSKSHFGKPRINTFISNKFIYSPSQPFIPNIKELADEPSGSNAISTRTAIAIWGSPPNCASQTTLFVKNLFDFNITTSGSGLPAPSMS